MFKFFKHEEMKTLIRSTDFNKELLNALKSINSIRECLLFLGENKNRSDLNRDDQDLIQRCIFMINLKHFISKEIPFFDSQLMDHFAKLEDWKFSHEWVALIPMVFPEYKIAITEPQKF